MAEALQDFHEHRVIFVEAGITADNISLPRQHALDHYITGITQFGSPNSLCTSITESKHIRAVKEPWRRSSKHNALGQILETNQQLDKLSEARVTFKAYGLLEDNIIVDTLRNTRQLDDGMDDPQDNGINNSPDVSIDDPSINDLQGKEEDAGRVDGPEASLHVEMSRRSGMSTSVCIYSLTEIWQHILAGPMYLP
jgi:hypothetical protein